MKHKISPRCEICEALTMHDLTFSSKWYWCAACGSLFNSYNNQWRPSQMAKPLQETKRTLEPLAKDAGKS